VKKNLSSSFWIKLLIALLMLAPYLALAAEQPEIPDELKDDRDLPREERILRHQKRVQLILEQRQKAKEEERQRQIEEARQKAAAAQAGRVPQPAPTLPPHLIKQAQTGETLSLGAPVSNIMASMILHFYPFDVNTVMGDNFLTDIQIINLDRQSIEEVGFKVVYDPRFLAPVYVNDYEIIKFVDGAPEYAASQEKGEITYRAKFKEPQVLDGTNLLRVVWKPLKMVEYTEVDFDLTEKSTYVKARGKDVLGIPSTPHDGAIPLGVTILNNDKKGSEKILVDPEMIKNLGRKVSDKPLGNVTLRLEKSANDIKAGDVFDVSVMLSNPDSESFDSVALYIKFDPDYLRVVDWDKGNWVTLGINIQDGFARKRYPFDYHLRNDASNYLGRIEYRMGTTVDAPMPTGEMAKIRFRAIAPAEKAEVRFIRTKRRFPNTAITSLGREVLSDLQWQNEDLQGIAIVIGEAQPDE